MKTIRERRLKEFQRTLELVKEIIENKEILNTELDESRNKQIQENIRFLIPRYSILIPKRRKGNEKGETHNEICIRSNEHGDTISLEGGSDRIHKGELFQCCANEQTP